MFQDLVQYRQQYPALSRVADFFEAALSQAHVANTFVFLGDDLAPMLQLIHTLTAILNCSDATSEQPAACGACQHCRWIAQNAHPGMMTLTNWDWDAQKLKQGIQVEQFNELLSELMRHSGGFKRTVILVALRENEQAASAGTEIALGDYPAFLHEAVQAGQVVYAPLDRLTFSDKVANKLLKTLEEPPRDTHFFIVTDSERQLLDTILSRAQVLRFASAPRKAAETAVFPEALNALYSQIFESTDTDPIKLTTTEPVEIVHDVQAAATALSLSPSYVLRLLQEKASVALAQQVASQDAASFCRFQKRLACVEETRRQLDAHVREDAALEGLGLSLLATLV